MNKACITPAASQPAGPADLPSADFAARPASLDRLFPELVAEVADHLAGTRGLLALAATSRRMRSIVSSRPDYTAARMAMHQAQRHWADVEQRIGRPKTAPGTETAIVAYGQAVRAAKPHIPYLGRAEIRRLIDHVCALPDAVAQAVELYALQAALPALTPDDQRYTAEKLAALPDRGIRTQAATAFSGNRNAQNVDWRLG